MDGALPRPGVRREARTGRSTAGVARRLSNLVSSAGLTRQNAKVGSTRGAAQGQSLSFGENLKPLRSPRSGGWQDSPVDVVAAIERLVARDVGRGSELLSRYAA